MAISGGAAARSSAPAIRHGTRIAQASPWPHRDAELLQLAGAGRGPTAIAETMGLRLNQVVGRMARLRVDGQLPPPERPGSRAVRPTLAAPASVAGAAADQAESRLPPPPLPTPLPLPMPEAPEQGLPDSTSPWPRRDAELSQHLATGRSVYAVATLMGLSVGDVVLRCGQLGIKDRSAAPRTGADTRAKAQPIGRVIECCWPLGEPGRRDFRFCCEPSEPGKQYCTDHCDLAWPLRKAGRERPEGLAA